MGAMLAAYVCVWLMVSAYVAWLGVKQRQLNARLDAVIYQMEQDSSSDSFANVA
jgi:CcmD family protein